MSDTTFVWRGEELELWENRGEATCAVCGEPIRWCLDMFSFTTGSRKRLAHARCVWTKEAFTEERKRAVT